jgi:hypothetical protein
VSENAGLSNISGAILDPEIVKRIAIAPPARQEIHIYGETYDIICPVTPSGDRIGIYAQIVATMLAALADIPAVRDTWERHGITVKRKEGEDA